MIHKLRDATVALPAPTARRARAAGEQGHKRFTRSYTLAVLTLWSLLRWCSWSCSRPRRSCTLAVLTLGLLLPLLRCCSSWCWRSCSCPSCCSCWSCVACNAWGSLASRASRSMIARFLKRVVLSRFSRKKAPTKFGLADKGHSKCSQTKGFHVFRR